MCLAFNGQLSEHHRSAHGGAGIPNNWYQSIWFKVVFDFCSKMKVVNIVFWPYHCVEEEETKPLVKTASKSDVGNVRTRPHAPTTWQSTRADAPHASSSPGWADPTRIPVDPTRVTDPDMMMSSWRNGDISMHSSSTKGWRQPDVMVTSSCTVCMPCQRPVSWHVSTEGPTHVIHREPSRSWGIGSSVVDSTCNRIWYWIWAVD